MLRGVDPCFKLKNYGVGACDSEGVFDVGVFIGAADALGVGAAIEGADEVVSAGCDNVAASGAIVGMAVGSGVTAAGVGSWVVPGTGATGVSIITAGRPDEKVLVKSLCS